MMKKLIVAVLLLCLALAMVACAGETPNNNTEDTKVAEPSTQVTESKFNGYVVTVVDTEGKPVTGAMLQICKVGEGGLCVPSFVPSDAEGKVYFDVEADSYKASFMQMPAGYAYVDEAVTDFYFDGDAKELTVVVKKA